VRDLAERARADLNKRITGLIDAERARYLDLLDSLQIAEDAPDLLRASSRRVDDLRFEAQQSVPVPGE
jgi:hypothetical protein